MRSQPELTATTGDLKHYRCGLCGWTWGSELPPNRTACPVQDRHRGLLKARKLRAQHRGGAPVSVGDLLSAAEDSQL